MTSERSRADDADVSIEGQRTFYDNRWAVSGKLWSYHTDRMAFISERLGETRRRAGRPLRILDFGCGQGRFAGLASEYGHVEAIDLSPKGIDVARQKFPGPNYHVASVYDYTSDEPFDAVMSVDVIEHLEDQEAYVSKCAELLKPGGQLLLTVPNRAAGRWFWASEKNRGAAQPIENWLSRSDVRALLADDFTIRSLGTRDAAYSHKGLMRIVNSVKLGRLCGCLGIRDALGRLWEKVGYGLYLFVDARRT